MGKKKDKKKASAQMAPPAMNAEIAAKQITEAMGVPAEMQGEDKPEIRKATAEEEEAQKEAWKASDEQDEKLKLPKALQTRTENASTGSYNDRNRS